MLNKKKELFAREYVIDLNATKAAQRAGYSEKTAYAQGHRLLKDVEVKQLVRQYKQERIERLEFSADDVMRELAAIAFADITDVVSVHNNTVKVTNTKSLSPMTCKAIESIKETSSEFGQNISVKMHSKISALQALGKHFGILKDSVEHSGNVTLEQMIGGSFEKQ